MVKAEEAQVEMFVSAARPDSGPRCSVPGCGKRLYAYELEWGKCFKHKYGGIIQRREEKIPVTDAATRERTRNGYHRRKNPQAAGRL